MPIHVSIHDVSPAWSTEVDQALAMCHAHKIKPGLLVVPNFHGEWPLQQSPEYVSHLQQLQKSGHEIFLHGFYHQSRTKADAESNIAQQARWLFAQRVASGGEAEFSDVTRDEAIVRLNEGERVFARTGLISSGFIPPAWSMHPWFIAILKERGYRYCEDHLFIYDPARGIKRASLVLNYASRSKARMASTIAYCRIAKYARRFFPTRIAIHPADMRVPRLREEIEHLLQWASGDVVERADDLFR